MKRFKNILLVLEGNSSDRTSIRRAAWLARNNKARLTAAMVVPGFPIAMTAVSEVIAPGELERLVREDALRSIREATKSVRRQKDVKLELKVLYGKPFVEIILEVLRNKHDLVIHTAEEEGSLNERLFGTTTMHLMRKCPCPVWVVKPSRRRTYARVLAAIAPSVGDESAAALNRKVLELATSLATLQGGRLHVAHAWTLYGESILRGSARLPRQELNRLLREEQQRAKTMLEELLKPFALDKRTTEVHLSKGHPEEIIPQVVRKERIDIVVMGTLSRAGVAGILIGNTAEKTLWQVDCSVLAVKPEGFVTPIQLPSSESLQPELLTKTA